MFILYVCVSKTPLHLCGAGRMFPGCWGWLLDGLLPSQIHTAGGKVSSLQWKTFTTPIRFLREREICIRYPDRWQNQTDLLWITALWRSSGQGQRVRKDESFHFLQPACQTSLNPSALISSSSSPPSLLGARNKGPIWKAFSRASETHRAGECFDVYRDVSRDVTDLLRSTGGQSAVSG